MEGHSGRTPPGVDDPILQAGSRWPLVENLANGVYFVDRERRIRYWNKGAEDLSGYPATEVVGRHCYDDILAHVDDAGTLLCHSACPLEQAMAEAAPQEATVWLRHARGHRVPVRVRTAPVRDERGEIIGAVEIFDDATLAVDAREHAEAASRAALIDPITGLPNRRQLDLALESRMAGLARYGWGFGLLAVDVDGMASVNSGNGHDVGDAVLRMVGSTVAGGVRVDDFAGRWGGEEFVVIASCVDMTGLIRLAERIRALVAASATRTLDGPVSVTVCIGGTLARASDSRVDLLARTEGALYEAKRSGPDRVALA